MNIRLITEYSPWFYPLCLILGFVYAFLLYYKDNKLEDVPGLLKKLLFLIRFLTVSFIAFLLFAPLINSWISKTEKPTLVFAFDNSEALAGWTVTGDVAVDATKGHRSRGHEPPGHCLHQERRPGDA